jgi:hypothetical protein
MGCSLCEGLGSDSSVGSGLALAAKIVNSEEAFSWNFGEVGSFAGC